LIDDIDTYNLNKNMAQEILDTYEVDYDFKKLKNSVKKSSDETLWGKHGLFSCLTHEDNSLPQLLRMNYQHRFELLVIMTKMKINGGVCDDFCDEE